MRTILAIVAILLPRPFVLCVESSSTNSDEPGLLLRSSLNLDVYVPTVRSHLAAA
jgi:hypothetical protein